jgi:hypothetical protein
LPACQRLFAKFASSNHAAAEERIEFLLAQVEILKALDPHETALMETLGDQKQPRAIKADRLQKLTAFTQEDK